MTHKEHTVTHKDEVGSLHEILGLTKHTPESFPDKHDEVKHDEGKQNENKPEVQNKQDVLSVENKPAEDHKKSEEASKEVVVQLTNNERVPSNWKLFGNKDGTISGYCGGHTFEGTTKEFNTMLRTGKYTKQG